uniref:Uncharacterized protein n=2 Tax=Anthurium amnicola TaxID=1678845 RepID=A0A1D1XNX9_9ARAE
MESSQLVGGAEECSSSESGWTMYLASPMHDADEAEIEDEEGEDETYDDEEEDDHGGGGGGNNDDDGDSLASDASSGPPHRTLSHKNGAGGGALPKEDDEEEEDDRVEDGNGKLCKYSWKKAHKKVEKKRDDGGATVSHMGDGAASHFCSTDKVKKH